MRAGLVTLLVAIAVGGLPAASAQDTSLDVTARSSTNTEANPERAIEQATALSPAALTAPELGRAVSNFESAASAGVLVAAVHAGRLLMLRGDDTLARRLFEQAATAPTPSTRYLAHLFLESMDERDGDPASAERHSSQPWALSLTRRVDAWRLARCWRGTDAPGKPPASWAALRPATWRGCCSIRGGCTCLPILSTPRRP